jgi:hypothetical protein
MADVLYLLTIVAAFAGLAGLVRVCDRVMGSGPARLSDEREPVGSPAAEG